MALGTVKGSMKGLFLMLLAAACRLCNLRQVVVSHLLKFNLLDTSTSLPFHFVFKTLVVCLMFLSFS